MSETGPLISVCMIVRDEEERLPRCLAAARALADDLVVADTGSRDRSREIVMNAGGRIVDSPWCQDFSAARNASLEAAIGRWIVVIDADEVLEPFDASTFRQKLAAGHEEAFTLEIRSRLAGEALSIAHITRVFRNRPQFRYSGRLHEQIVPSIVRWMGCESLDVPRSGLTAMHDGYLPESRQSRGKGERNEDLLRLMVAEQPEDGSACFFLARELSQEVGSELLRTPRTREALELYARAWAALKPQSSTLVADLGCRLARARILFGPHAGLSSMLDALERRFGPRLQIHFARGELALVDPANPAAAEAHFRRAIEFGKHSRNPLGELDERYSHAWPLERVARCHVALGQPNAARDMAKNALERYPSEAGPRLLLAQIAITESEPHAALTFLVEAAKRAPNDPRPQLELARILASLGKQDAAKRSREAALRIAPGWEDALQPS